LTKKVFFVSGNDKDSPDDIYTLKDAIEEGYDFVQGSRYLSGGKYGGMPIYRKVATKMIITFLISIFLTLVIVTGIVLLLQARKRMREGNLVKTDYRTLYNFGKYLYPAI